MRWELEGTETHSHVMISKGTPLKTSVFEHTQIILITHLFVTAPPIQLQIPHPILLVKGGDQELMNCYGKDSLCVLACRFCISRKSGTGGGAWGHPQDAVLMAAARLGCKKPWLTPSGPIPTLAA